ncbi:M56 family metallopeptidase [Litorimonas sp. WD9-15]|uniref:M56 family metallopeptidase n=1 Tax=Litorimonas sp. WD9-15 TaxID=3418716 RepID=UPI003D030C33
MTPEAVMDWAVQTGFVVSLLIVGILIIRRPFARAFGAGATYALWLLPLIRLVLPVIAIPQSWLPGRFRPQPEATGPMADVTARYQTPSPDTFPVADPSLPLDEFIAPTQQGFDWTPMIIGIWSGVAVSWFAFQLFRQRAFLLQMRRTSDFANETLLAEGRVAGDITGLKAVPILRVSHQNIGPFVTGVVSPTVILPSDFMQDYTPAQRHYALVHEFAHIKRKDLWAAFAALVFRAINWFNPLVHYAVHKMRVDQEAACDAFVIAKTGQSGTNKLDYAKTLLQAAKTTGSSAAGAHLALSLVETDEAEIEEKETSND